MLAFEIPEAFRLAAVEHHSDEGWIAKKTEAHQKNQWFTPENINQALDQWLEALKPEYVAKWLGENAEVAETGKTLGIIMAGNLPFVGMHDLLCGLVTGMKLKIKTSSDDDVLPKYWVQRAIAMLEDIGRHIEFSEDQKSIDAAIVTGSNNTARYFEYYFRHIPYLLRKNRNSISILHGNESAKTLEALGHDVFDFYGLGCRNVTHLCLPEGYAFKPLFDAWEPFYEVLNHHKYANNYNYHKALLLLNLDPHMDTGYLLLKERPDIYSPVGMLNYSFYSDSSDLHLWIEQHASEIQCITSEMTEFTSLLPGQAQKTMLWDYADQVDTLNWLRSLKF